MGRLGRRLGAPLAGLMLAANGAGPVTAQQLSGSLEAGLQTLAQALLAGLPEQRRPSLSVMPFPAADQACSVLSVFVVDELTTTLIGGVTPRPRVVERQQLETIIAQERLDEFLTDPEQRRRLGGKSGIGALVVGTYAVIGDRVRLNARLVAIESGEAIAAAAVSVPRTSELSELLRQDAGRGRNCAAPTIARRSADVAGTGAGAVPAAAMRDAPPPEGCNEQDGLRICIRSLRRNGQEAQAMLEVENTGGGDLALALVGPAPTLVDPDGRSLAAREASGLPICGSSMAGVYMNAQSQAACLSGNVLDHRQFRAIRGGGRAAIGLTFRANAPAAATGESYMLSATFAVLPKPSEGGAETTSRQRQAQVYLVSLPDLRPNDATRR